MKKTIILASSSPRRINMMKDHGFDPVIIPADIEEHLPSGIGMRDAVMFLALKKALAVEHTVLPTHKGSVIIAADTVVYKDEILGKPKDRQDAFSMLTKIKNTGHYVATGVAIIEAGKPHRHVFCDVTEVFCKNYTNEDLNACLLYTSCLCKSCKSGDMGIRNRAEAVSYTHLASIRTIAASSPPVKI